MKVNFSFLRSLLLLPIAVLLIACSAPDEPIEYSVEFPDPNSVEPGVLKVAPESRWDVNYYDDEMTGQRRVVAVTGDMLSFLKFIKWQKSGSTSLRLNTSHIQDVYSGKSYKVELKFDDDENYVTSAFLSDCDIKAAVFTRCYYQFPEREKAFLISKMKSSNKVKIRVAGQKVLDFSLSGSSDALNEVELAFR